jgi:hypothetical protein
MKQEVISLNIVILKEEGMFATMLVQLPVEGGHAGGILTIENYDEEVIKVDGSSFEIESLQDNDDQMDETNNIAANSIETPLGLLLLLKSLIL